MKVLIEMDFNDLFHFAAWARAASKHESLKAGFVDRPARALSTLEAVVKAPGRHVVPPEASGD